MNLQHILTQLPYEHLQGLAEEFGLSSLSPSKTNLIHAVNKRYRDETFMRILFEELHFEAKGILGSLLFFAPHDDDVITLSPSWISLWCKQKTLDEHIHEIVHRGFLFPFNKEEYRFLFPTVIRSLLIHVLIGALQPNPVEREITLHEETAPDTGLEGIYHLLCVLRHHPAKQTQKGDLHRKTYERWISRFSCNPPSESFFDFLLPFCEEQNLLSLKNDRYKASASVREWFAQGDEKNRAAWISYIQEKKIFTDPEFLTLLIVLLLLLHSGIREKKTAIIVNKDRLFSCYQAFSLFRHDLDTVSKSQFNWMIEWLLYSGIVQSEHAGKYDSLLLREESFEFLSGKTDNERVQSHQPDPCLLQPSFQLLVPPNYGYQDLWDLDECAEFLRRDIMTEFHLTKDRVLQALRAGWTPSRLREFFLNLTKGKVPDNVLYSMEEWCSKFGQIRLRRVVLLECKSQDLAEEIHHIPEIQSLNLEKISDRYYVLDEKDYKKVYQILLDRGYEPSILK